MRVKVWMIALLIISAAILLALYRALWDHFESPVRKGRTLSTFHQVLYPVILWVTSASAYAAAKRGGSVASFLARVSASTLLILLWMWTPRTFPDYHWPPACFTLLLTFPAILTRASSKSSPGFSSASRAALDSYLIFAAVFLAILKDNIR